MHFTSFCFLFKSQASLFLQLYAHYPFVVFDSDVKKSEEKRGVARAEEKNFNRARKCSVYTLRVLSVISHVIQITFRGRIAIPLVIFDYFGNLDFVLKGDSFEAVFSLIFRLVYLTF